MLLTINLGLSVGVVLVVVDVASGKTSGLNLRLGAREDGVSREEGGADGDTTNAADVERGGGDWYFGVYAVKGESAVGLLLWMVLIDNPEPPSPSFADEVDTGAG